MKKIFLFWFIAWNFLALSVIAAESSVYIPLDHVRVPLLGKEWTAVLGEGKARIEYARRSKLHQQSKDSIQLLREPLGSGRPEAWQGKARAALPRDVKITAKKRGPSAYEVGYRYSKDLIPIAGSRIYFANGPWLYEWRCEVEETGLKDAQAWCGEQFDKIRWLEPIAAVDAKNPPEFESTVQDFPVDLASLEKIEEKILLGFQGGKPTLSALQSYGYYLVFRSIFFAPADEAQRTALIDNLNIVATALEKNPHSKTAALWMRVHGDYLKGSLAYRQLEALTYQQPMPPYWLLSLWSEPQNRDTAIYLARRQVATRPLHDYVLGKVLYGAGRATEAIPFLEKAARGKNILAANLLAQSYLQTGQSANAQKWARAALQQNKQNTEAWLSLASALSKDDANLEKSNQIYNVLIAQDKLPPADRVRVYLQWAKNSPNTEVSLSYYEKVLEIEPKNLQALYAAGRIYLIEKNDKTKGLDLIDRYLRIASHNDSRVLELQKMVGDLRTAEDKREVVPNYVSNEIPNKIPFRPTYTRGAPNFE